MRQNNSKFTQALVKELQKEIDVTAKESFQYHKDAWEEAGFNMVDPKPLLNANTGNGNYFFFIHPSSANGVLWEFVSMTSRNAEGEGVMDWHNVETYMVSPDVN